MAVVFDEVEATVAPAVNERTEPEATEEVGETQNQPEKFYQNYMEHKWREKRLWAD